MLLLLVKTPLIFSFQYRQNLNLISYLTARIKYFIKWVDWNSWLSC